MRSSLVRQIVQMSVLVMVIALLLFWQSDRPSVYARGNVAIRAGTPWHPWGDRIETRPAGLYKEEMIDPRRTKESFMPRPNQIVNQDFFEIEHPRIKIRVNADVTGFKPNYAIRRKARS